MPSLFCQRTATEIVKVAVLFHRLGPYHWARLCAAASVFEILAVEQSAETFEYLWDKVESAGPFQRETLFSSTETSQGPREIAGRLAPVLERFRPDAVAIPGWSARLALSALAWCRGRGVPAVVFSESTALDSTRSCWKEWLKKRVVSLCASSLVGGTRHQEYLEQLGIGSDRIFYGYDAVDNEHFGTGADRARVGADHMRSKLELPESYFLASGRFIPEKNLFMLLEAYAAYRQSVGPRHAWALVVLGDGPMRQDIWRARAELGLRDAVVLPGFKQYDELPAFYGLAGAFVHASTSEPWGLVVNEAMAAGLPVLVSQRCGCAADLVRSDRNGYCFDPADRVALSALLQQVASMRSEERDTFGVVSRAIINHWGLPRFATGLQGAVRKACADAPSPCGSWVNDVILRMLAAR